MPRSRDPIAWPLVGSASLKRLTLELQRMRKSIAYHAKMSVDRGSPRDGDGALECLRLIFKQRHSKAELTVFVLETGELSLLFWDYHAGRRSFQLEFRGSFADQIERVAVAARDSFLTPWSHDDLLDLWSWTQPHDILKEA